MRVQIEGAGFDVCAEAAGGMSVVDLAARTHPDICLLDADMPSSIAAAVAIHQRLPTTKIVMLAGSAGHGGLSWVLAGDGWSLIPSDVDPARIPYVLRALVDGEADGAVEFLRGGPRSGGSRQVADVRERL